MRIDSGGIRFQTDQIIPMVLFLFAVDVLDLSGILLALAMLLFLFFRLPDLEFDMDAVILVLFSAFYFGSVAFYEGLTVDVVIKYAIAPWGCYLLGYTLRRTNRSISVVYFALMIAFGFFLHGMLNLYSSIQVFGASFNNNYRQAFDFWQSRSITVTTASLYYTPFTVMSIGAIFFARRMSIKALAAVSVGLALYASMIYQNRTLILACGLVGAMNVLLVLLDPDIPMTKKYLMCGAMAFVALLIVIAFLANVGGIRDTIMNSSLMNRMSAEDQKQDRTTIWKSFIFGEAWKYPFGGTKAVLYDHKPFVHNTWLDAFRRGGFFPFVFLCTFTVRSALSTVSFARLGKVTGEETGVVLSLLAGMMLSFMVEPVIEANPYVFYLPILVMGTINGHNRDVRNILREVSAILQHYEVGLR